MHYPLAVIVDANGLPTAEVPFACMWDLVEYLSCQRATVTYRYESSHFKVTFPRLSVDAAQSLVNDWSKTGTRELQPA